MAGDALFGAHAEWLATVSGWGTYASLLVPFTEALDEPLPESAFRLIRLDEPSPDVPLRPVHHADMRFVELVPGHPLAPDARYALVVGHGLTAGGVALARPEGFVPSPDVVSALGGDETDVILSVELTTRDVRAGLFDAASQVADAEPVADFTADASATPWPHGIHERDAFLSTFDGSLRDTLAEGLAHAGTVAVGTFTSREFRGDDGVFDPARVDGTTAAPESQVEVIVVLPDPSAFPPPWRTTIVQHGFGGSNQVVFERAEMFNRHGIAVVGIDALGHGNRGSFLDFFQPDDPRVAQDNFRQTVLDQLQLCRLVAGGALDLDGVAGADLDGSCHYWGQSMGAMLGAIHVAVAPDDKNAVLNVGGGGMSRILLSEVLKAAFGLLLAPELDIALGDPTFDRALPMFLWSTQTLFEGGDPINYGSLVLRDGGAHVLMQISVDDGIMPNEASEALAATIGVSPLSKPQTNDEGIDALWWIDLAALGIDALPPRPTTSPASSKPCACRPVNTSPAKAPTSRTSRPDAAFAPWRRTFGAPRANQPRNGGAPWHAGCSIPSGASSCRHSTGSFPPPDSSSSTTSTWRPPPRKCGRWPATSISRHGRSCARSSPFAPSPAGLPVSIPSHSDCASTIWCLPRSVPAFKSSSTTGARWRSVRSARCGSPTFPSCTWPMPRPTPPSMTPTS